LTLSLEGPAAEVLKDFDDSTETAYEDLWKRIEHRFGEVDESREAQRKFGNRRQTESECLQEYEQALRTLYKQGWPSVTTEIRDAALKGRFEDGVASLSCPSTYASTTVSQISVRPWSRHAGTQPRSKGPRPKRQSGFWQRLNRTMRDSPPSLSTCGSWRRSWTRWSVIGPVPGLQKRPLEGRARLHVVPVLSPETGRVETLPCTTLWSEPRKVLDGTITAAHKVIL